MVKESIMKKVLVTWGCSGYTGDTYIDSYLEVPEYIIKLGMLSKDLNIADKKAQEYANNISAMRIRARINTLDFAMFKVPDDFTREAFYIYLEDDKLGKLQKATIRL